MIKTILASAAGMVIGLCFGDILPELVIVFPAVVIIIIALIEYFEIIDGS